MVAGEQTRLGDVVDRDEVVFVRATVIPDLVGGLGIRLPLIAPDGVPGLEETPGAIVEDVGALLRRAVSVEEVEAGAAVEVVVLRGRRLLSAQHAVEARFFRVEEGERRRSRLHRTGEGQRSLRTIDGGDDGAQRDRGASIRVGHEHSRRKRTDLFGSERDRARPCGERNGQDRLDGLLCEDAEGLHAVDAETAKSRRGREHETARPVRRQRGGDTRRKDSSRGSRGSLIELFNQRRP